MANGFYRNSCKKRPKIMTQLPKNLEIILIERAYSVRMNVDYKVKCYEPTRTFSITIIRLVNVIYVAVGFFPVSGDFKKEIVSAKRKFDLKR